MLRTVLAIVCLLSLTACGLKGPLYLPERTPQPAAPMATAVPTSPFEEQSSQSEDATEAPASETTSQPPKAAENSTLESSTMLAP